MRQYRLVVYGLLLLSLATLLGCGGGGGNSQTQQVFGYADFSVVWPSRQRIVPTSAQSVSITVTDGANTTKTLVIKYPATSTTFNPLPFGTFTYTALACPTTDGTGIPVGKATGSFTLTQQSYRATFPLTADIASTIVSIQITPALTALKQGETKQLSINPLDAGGHIVLTNNTLTVQSSNPSVVSLATDDKVTGLIAGSSTITASESDSGKHASLSITVPEVSVSVTPSMISLDPGAGTDFSASVVAANTGVAWSIQEGAAGGTISSAGHYTAPAALGTYHVVATSTAFPSKKTVVKVTVPAVTVGVSPALVTMPSGTPQQFTASVSGTTSNNVTWSLQEAGGGTVTTDGLYTSPVSSGTYHVVVTSADDPSKSATATMVVSNTRTNPQDGSAMVWVPAGNFIMGTPADVVAALNTQASSTFCNCEMPQHTVYLDGYWIYQNEVSVAQFRAFCDAKNYSFNWYYSNWTFYDANPITGVSWDDSQAYAQWVGGTLPTEAQWEKAGRGTNGKNYPWGGTATASDPCNGWDVTKCGNWLNSTNIWSIGSFPSGASPYGALDMTGNVTEWCADWFDANYYSNSATSNPTGPATGTSRVTRGQYWDGANAADKSPIYYRVAARNRADPSSLYTDLGFRCCQPAQGPCSVQINPNPATVAVNKTQQFTVAVTGLSNTAVTWQVVESGGGSITQSGVYTAPATHGVYHVKATPVAYPYMSDIVTVKVVSGGEVITVQ